MPSQIKTDQILVVDVESTCWEGEPPPGQESEIIEIGFCVLRTADLTRTVSGSWLVRPVMSTVSPFCTKLTTLTQEMLDREGCNFTYACGMLRNLGARNVTWASYGDYDRKMFDRQTWHTKAKGKWAAEYPFSPRHINVKNLCALMLGWDREVGMDEALKRLGLPLEGTHHRGSDDARNIAAILGALLGRGRKS